MMTPDQECRLVKLEAYVVEAAGKSPGEFWRGFDDLAGDLGEEAYADDADGELIERYTSLLANADEGGFAVPPEAMGVARP
ncbi:hypothetical protein DCD74_11885 [Lysobacter oculi]|uniref:Uncharacterized protein n=1 Tax=Solilutibacter oculi TaxID=2698682 RepID=A0A344J606_9GAMM|nr:hypothetical protein [Lysobacter oculi]AXA84466.1 hypothetical protein DCD74_06995 [Lysobacter oculi]AXA85280.1 hypothetical protein DCD74_11885 [Lysobacter oculi]